MVTGQNPARMRGRGFVRRLLRLGSKMAVMAALVPVFVDGVPVVIQSVPPTGVELRPVPVLVNTRDLSPGCHFVELYVSSKFKDGTDLTKPERRDDVAYILWTFINTTDATVASCGGG
jgi:hypothetical protein